MNLDILKTALDFFTNSYSIDEAKFEDSLCDLSFIEEVLSEAAICEAYEDMDTVILADEVLSLVDLIERITK